MNTVGIGLLRLWKRFTGWPRAAVLEGVFMFLNDLFFLFIWYMAISKNAVAGWGVDEALLFLGSSMAGFAIASIFFGGRMNFQRFIDGSFDIYFLRPRSVWLQYMTDGTSLSILGDLAAGLLLLSLSSYPLWAKAFTVLSVVFIDIALSTVLASIFMGLRMLSESAAKRVWDLAFANAVWPSHTIKESVLRWILIFVVPGLLYVTIPIEVLRGESPPLTLVVGYFFWGLIAAVLWRWGIRRYTGVSGYGWMRD